MLFRSDTTIKNIRIYKADEVDYGLEIWKHSGTLQPNDKVKSPAFKLDQNYMIYFSTKDGKEYRYSAYEECVLENIGDNMIYSNADFSAIE